MLVRAGAAARRRARCCAPPRGLRPLRCCPPTRAGVYVSFVGFSLRIAVGCLVSESLTANKRCQGEILPSIPSRFGCLDATHFSGSQAVRLTRRD